MASLTFDLVLGNDQAVYENLMNALPAGENNLTRGVVVPAHPANKPQTFQINNVVPNTPYTVDIVGEWQTAPITRMFFTSPSNFQLLTVALPLGPTTVTISSPTESRQFIVSVTNFATLFRSYAKELTEYSIQPLTLLKDAISNELAYRLATPLLTKLTTLIPADLEVLTSLSYKLLIKNLLHFPGTDGATREILAAFCASNPIMYRMQNINKFDAPLYRSEELFQGYEAHVWMPNREIERWKAFITLLANLPQLYLVKQITESEVYVEVGGRLKRHLFDFDSPMANSITTGVTYLSDCFLRLFTLGVTVQSEHWISFCQASYILDQRITNTLSPTSVDPIGLENTIAAWDSYSLSGRFDQQYGISSLHSWVYDSPIGDVDHPIDGINRFFKQSVIPASFSSVKLFVDGLLKHLYIDYRISMSGNILSGAYRVDKVGPAPWQSILMEIVLGEPRPFVAPIFSGLEVRGGAYLQLLLTNIEAGFDNVSFVVSHAPTIVPDDPQDISIHYLTPNKPNSGVIGENQYGSVNLTAGVTSYELTFTQPTASIDYQLMIALTVDPMPNDSPREVQQVAHIVRTHTQTGAFVEFSAAVAANTKLNWWVIEDDSQMLERGTVILANGDVSHLIEYANGPYFDQVVVILQIWNIDPTYVDASQYLVSFALNTTQLYAMFSHAIEGSNYRLDYCVFPALGGNFIEFYEAPATGSLIEAHYDVSWPHWRHSRLSPLPDGVNTSFTMIAPCTDPKSVYFTVDGRLMTQGANNQYIVSGDKIVTNFVPAEGQILWTVFPVDVGGRLTSSWDQGFLNRLPTSVGEYATGWIKIPNTILPQDTITISGIPFEAVATATGTLVNPSGINIGASVLWSNIHNITLTTSQVNVVNSRFEYQNHSFIEGTVVRLSTTGLLPTGLSTAFPSYISNATLTTFQLKLNLDNSTPIQAGSFVIGTGYTILAIGTTDFTLIGASSNTENTYFIATGIGSGSGTAKVTYLPIAFSSTGSGLLTFSSQVTISAIPYEASNENEFRVVDSQSEDAQAMVKVINAHPILSPILLATYTGSGITTVKSKKLGNGMYNIAMSASGTSIQSASITGDSAVSSYNEHTLNLLTLAIATHTNIDPTPVEAGDLVSGVSYEIVTLGTTDFTQQGASSNTVGTIFVANSVQGSGTGTAKVTLVNTFYHEHPFYDGLQVKITTVGLLHGSLPPALAEDPPYYVINSTALSFQISSTLNGSPLSLETQDGSLIVGKTYVIARVGTSDFTTVGALYNTKGTAFIATGVGANSHTGTVYPVGYQMFTGYPVEVATSTFAHPNHSFIVNEPVDLSSDGNLPSGFASDTKYYILSPTTNRFQLTASPGGSAIAFTSAGSGRLTIKSHPHFPAGNGKVYDAEALILELAIHPKTKLKVAADIVSDGYIAITAKQIGTEGDDTLSVTGTSMQVHGLSHGKNPDPKIIYSTNKLCYNYNASVASLDGLSTRLWDQYNGDKFIFDYPPTLQQEGYFISEVFPVDYHPMDSTAANLPECNYPKGVFTQGFGAFISETNTPPVYEWVSVTKLIIGVDYTIVFVGTTDFIAVGASLNAVGVRFTATGEGTGTGLVCFAEVKCSIIITNMPIQEMPSGVINGVNKVFTLSITSSAGQKSLMLWIDGVFQPPDAYIYDEVGGSDGMGRITLANAPVVGQWLWVWYLPKGSSVSDYERVVQPVGIIDGVNGVGNAIFTMTESWVESEALILFLEGLFALQLSDYMLTGSTIQFNIAPETGQSLWAHYNLGGSSPDRWRQIQVITAFDSQGVKYTLPNGVTDGIASAFLIDSILTTELPISLDATLLFLDGLNQGGKYTLELDANGNPTGRIVFAAAPEANRQLDAAFIRATLI